MKILRITLTDEVPQKNLPPDTVPKEECTEGGEIKNTWIDTFVISILVLSLIFSFAAALSSSFRQPIPIQHEDLPKM